MNSLPTQAILGAVTAAVAAVATATLGSLPLAIGLVSATAAMAYVAFAAQSERLRDGERLVYRPVYVRRHDVRHRVMSDD